MCGVWEGVSPLQLKRAKEEGFVSMEPKNLTILCLILLCLCPPRRSDKGKGSAGVFNSTKRMRRALRKRRGGIEGLVENFSFTKRGHKVFSGEDQ